MRIGRAIIIPAILALGVAGSAVAGSSIAVAAVHNPHSTYVQPTRVYPDIYYHA
jgi:hypothetical protein